MPFTLAHAAAAIPLLRPLGRWGVLSALVFGSCAPDMPYFLALPVARTDSHSLPGMLWFCLPVGLSAYLLFHKLLKGPLLALLPDSVLNRLATQAATCTSLPAVHWGAVLVSLLCGTITHDIWDAFTHKKSWGTGLIPVLQQPLFTVHGMTTYGYSLAQHGSTVLGLALLGTWSLRWYRKAPVQLARLPVTLSPPAKLAVVAALLLIPLLIGIWTGLHLTPNSLTMVSEPRWAAKASAMVFATLPAFTLALLAYGLVWQTWRLRQPH